MKNSNSFLKLFSPFIAMFFYGALENTHSRLSEEIENYTNIENILNIWLHLGVDRKVDLFNRNDIDLFSKIIGSFTN